jgi:hypothetical protein
MRNILFALVLASIAAPSYAQLNLTVNTFSPKSKE